MEHMHRQLRSLLYADDTDQRGRGGMPNRARVCCWRRRLSGYQLPRHVECVGHVFRHVWRRHSGSDLHCDADRGKFTLVSSRCTDSFFDQLKLSLYHAQVGGGTECAAADGDVGQQPCVDATWWVLKTSTATACCCAAHAVNAH